MRPTDRRMLLALLALLALFLLALLLECRNPTGGFAGRNGSDRASRPRTAVPRESPEPPHAPDAANTGPARPPADRPAGTNAGADSAPLPSPAVGTPRTPPVGLLQLPVSGSVRYTVNLAHERVIRAVGPSGDEPGPMLQRQFAGAHYLIEFRAAGPGSRIEVRTVWSEVSVDRYGPAAWPPPAEPPPREMPRRERWSSSVNGPVAPLIAEPYRRASMLDYSFQPGPAGEMRNVVQRGLPVSDDDLPAFREAAFYVPPAAIGAGDRWQRTSRVRVDRHRERIHDGTMTCTATDGDVVRVSWLDAITERDSRQTDVVEVGIGCGRFDYDVRRGLPRCIFATWSLETAGHQSRPIRHEVLLSIELAE